MADKDDQNIIKCFTQTPNVVLYGLPQLPIQDRWALIALMGLCWDRSQTGKSLDELEGPYKLSLREISTLTGVDHTALRSKLGKNPREGVLDRLERFGYVAVREGKPIEEYTGVVGRTQTYIYIRLRVIWQENMLFTDEWRVPTNRLTASNLVAFTVDHVNTHVDHNNSTVGDINTHVDKDNHTVDATSTNYVLRQSNTKKINEDRDKILASNDAVPSLSQEELNKRVVNFVAQRKEVTCYDLEKYLQRFINAKGTSSLMLSPKNAIVWDSISNEYSTVVIGLVKLGKISVDKCSPSIYDHCRKPNLPVATTLEDHDERQWHPMVIRYINQVKE